MNAGVPGAHCSPGEVRQSSDARLPLRYEGDVDPLKYCTNGDHGQTGVPDGEQALDAASLSEIRASGSDQTFWIDIRSAGANIDLETLRSIEALLLGHVVAGEL